MKKKMKTRGTAGVPIMILTVLLLAACVSEAASSSQTAVQTGAGGEAVSSSQTVVRTGEESEAEYSSQTAVQTGAGGEEASSSRTAEQTEAEREEASGSDQERQPSVQMLCCGLPSAFDPAAVPAFEREAWADVNGDIPFFTEKEMADAGRMAAAAAEDEGEDDLRGFQVYGALDRLGRCTGACALVGPETLPREERGNISSVKPTGWHTVTYDRIDGNYLYNRCHLIGFQLTGQNVNEQNLVTGTRFMNIEGMLPYEDSVLAYVKGTGKHVLYRVSPVFEGDNLVAEGVLMEARSVEDPLVQFCAFCFNVQPGITIDYASGESTEADESAAGADPQKDIVRSSAGKAENGEWDYIVNVSSGIFHRPDCDSVTKMSERNKQGYCGTEEELIRMGYRPCKACSPQK